jgi:multidrug resistance efflux pump
LQLLAEIESPEIDQELLQARANLLQVRASLAQMQANYKQAQANLKQVQANLKQVQANMDMTRTTASRWQQLQQDEVVSPQQAEEKGF